MCSNEALKMSMDALAKAMSANTAAQRKTQDDLTALSSSMDTWKETRCEDHHRAIGKLQDESRDQGKAMARNAGKMVALVGLALFLVQAAAVVAAWLQLKPEG